MTKSMFRLGYTLLISGIMVAATEPSSSAGTKIQVTFSGSGFNGCFQYDQSQPKQAPHVFNFTGSGLSHQICYQIGGGTSVCTSGSECEPFQINTSGNNNTTFQLQATLLGSTKVLIVLPSSVTFSAVSLPFCNVGTTPVFQNTGTFTVTNAKTGVTIFTGNITATNCTQSAGAINCPCPPSNVPAPQAVVPYAPSKIAPAPPYAPSVVSMCAPRPPNLPSLCPQAAGSVLLDSAFFSMLPACSLSVNPAIKRPPPLELEGARRSAGATSIVAASFNSSPGSAGCSPGRSACS